MKSLRKQFLAAIAMTLVAAIALGSSTYAWFASNATVTGDGLKLTATTDASFLQISNAKDGTYGTSATAATKSDVKVYPSAHDAFASKGDITEPAKWYYGYSASSGTSTMTSEKTSLATAGLADYVLEYSYWIKAEESGQKLSNLKCTQATGDRNAVNAIVVGPDGYIEIGDTDQPASTTLASEITSTPTEIKVYLYLDGNDDKCISNSMSTLKSDISLTFATD